MASPQDLKVKLTVDASGVSTGINEATGKLKSFGGAASEAHGPMSKLGETLKGGLGFVGAAAGISMAIGFLKESTKAAVDDQKSMALLAQQLENTTGASKTQVAAVEAQIASLEELSGVADDKIRPAFATLVRATGDTSNAMKLQKVALDLAAGAHIPLETAAKALGKAYDGNTSALTRLVPAVKGAKDPIDAVAKSMAGAAKTAADNDPYARLAVAMDHIKETLGKALLPLINAFAGVLTAVMPIVESLSGFIGQLVAAIMPLIKHLMSSLMPTFTNLMNLILKVINIVLMPLIKVLDAVLVPVLALVTSYLNDYFIPGWNFLAEILKPIIDLVAGLLVGAFNGINKVFQAVAKFLKPVFDGFKTFLSVAIQIYDHIGKKLMVVFQALGNWLLQKLTPIWNGLMKAMEPMANWIKNVLGTAWTWLLNSVLKPVYNFLKPMIDAISQFLGLKDIKWNVTTTTDDKTDKVLGGPITGGGGGGGGGGGATGGDTAAKKADTDLVKYIKNTQKLILDARKTYDDAVQKANDKYGALIQKYADEMQSIIQASMDRLRNAFASATATDAGKMFADLNKEGTASADQLLNSLKTRLASIKSLATNAATLAGLGFSQTFIEQVVAQGPDAGNAMADALKNATPETQKQLQDVFRQTEVASNTGMDALAKQMYEKTGLATDAMTAQFNKANENMKQAQDDLATALKDAADTLNSSLMKINDDFTAYLLKTKADLKKHAAEIASIRNSINGSYVQSAPVYNDQGFTTSGNVSAPGSFMNTAGYNSGQGTVVNVTANTNASPQAIADTTVLALKYGVPYSKLTA